MRALPLQGRGRWFESSNAHAVKVLVRGAFPQVTTSFLTCVLRPETSRLIPQKPRNSRPPAHYPRTETLRTQPTLGSGSVRRRLGLRIDSFPPITPGVYELGEFGRVGC